MMHRWFMAALLVLASAGCAPVAMNGVTSPMAAGSSDAKPSAGTPHHPYDQPAPTNSRLIDPLLPQTIRHFALAPDRRRVAYSEEGKYPSEIFVATFGADTRKVGAVHPNISELQWSADGRALLYVEVVDREVPGEFSDWNLPRREVIAHRLMRMPVEGGELQEILKTERALHFQASSKRNEVYFSVLDETNGGFFATIRRLDLETGLQEMVLEAKAVEQFAVSPDGARLMAIDLDPSRGHEAMVKVLDLETKAIANLGPRPSGALNWAADSRSLIAIGAGSTSDGLVVQRFPLNGEAPETKRVPVAGNVQVGKLQLEMLSPDGRRVVAYAGQTNMIISLETGETRTLDSFGYIRCWLDDRTVMGAYRGGQYAVEIPD